MTLSRLLIKASLTVEEHLPPASKALIERYDEQLSAWEVREPMPEALIAARSALNADPSAALAMELRRRSNDAFRAEREAA